ncbi:MAG: Eco57I restriction-modification methylase domain-containing protein [Flavobacteriia bacterium]|nr:Eco57I restriction-modification methylase domain-containing protein [Flavobacteriia bacterium]
MSNITQKIKTLQAVYPQVYSYILPELPPNDGSQKIGYTELQDVHERIRPQVNTPAFKLEYELLWSAPAFYKNKKDSFIDKTFHKFLVKKGIIKKDDLGTEWFYFNGEPEKSKELFDLFRKEGFAALQNDNGKIDYKLREEQEEAVVKALEYFQNNNKGEFLWNAKPRFGKTLASYDLAKRLNATKVLILTNRPAIANSWFDDYEMFLDGYSFISTADSLKNRKAITREDHIAIKPIKPQLTFLSLQDLKGSKYFGGPYDKLRWVADLEWDLLIIDEAHEGVETLITKIALKVIKRKNTLHLSGTPFRALANQKFPQDAIYNWTYLDEQMAKQQELEEGEAGEHTDLPDLKLFTYRISQMITDQVNEGIEIDNETHDYAFDLNEFFRVKDKKFVHENDVKEFLRNLTTNKKYPFSTPELRNELKHTFWFVGNRITSVQALEQLLKKNPVFKDYKVIVAAGNGQTFEEEADDIKGNESSLEKVKKAIGENEKTITLSCGQLTTGVTIKEWSAVLMLTDIKSPALYMQAAFRAQNAYKEMRQDGLYMKKSAYLFDFAPTRVLEIYDQFANGLNPKAVKGEITEKDRENNIKELLNFFPVISEDVNGEMVELDANKVLTFPNALAATEIVQARFMTNLLFNDSLKGVFNFPKEVEDILDKMQVEKNKRVQKSNNTLDLDDARTVNNNKSKEINTNTEIILGEKIFKTNTERIVDNLLEEKTEEIYADELVKKVSEVAEPLIAKYKEVYKATQAETNEVTKQIQEKVKLIAEEYNSAEIKDSEALKQKLIEAIEVDFINKSVTQKEEEKVEKVQKTKEEEIRERLRSFTRTIPMFIMANSSKEEITIDNFDLEIDENDFIELTSINKEEFHKLRDGFNYVENGVRKTFQGVFNKYRFNASIAEFRLKKEQLANYFTSEEDIFELIPNQKTNQIFTPKKVVQMMINQLEEHDANLFKRTDSTFIDLYMKSGMYITEIVKKIFNNTHSQYKSDNECLKHILENQVYGLAPTPILQGITQSYIFGFDAENKISRKNFIQHDITPEAQEGKAKQKLQELFNLKEDMKFDSVVGNPPYMEMDGGAQASAKPIYNYFVESSKKLNPNYISLIMPSRWYSGGKGLDDFRDEMLNDKRIAILHDFLNPEEVFPNTNIRGGICYFLWDNNYDNEINLTKVFTHKAGEKTTVVLRSLKSGDSQTFVRYNDAVSIIEKVNTKNNFESFSNAISPLRPFGFRGFFINDEKFRSSSKDLKEPIVCYGKGKKIGYLERDEINVRDNWIDSYKVFTPRANNIGTELNDDNLNSFIGEPGTICTESYIVVGADLSLDKVSANHLSKYLTTRFVRFMHSLAKASQDATSKTYKFVPLQDFTSNSDIDWNKSIAAIDQQLYAKYNLSPEEIGFIESMIKPME